MNELIEKLSKPLPQDAIQRTKGIETKKGYDTTGYGYQYAVDRFNDILGENWGFSWDLMHEEQGKYRDKEYNGKTVPGASFWDITVKISIWINNKENIRTCVGGHTAINYADALKGAITNGFKKAASFWGVGRDAFAGTIDDDNQPLPDHAENKTETVTKVFPGSEEIQQEQFEIGQEVPKLYWSLSIDERKKYMPKGCKATKVEGKWVILKSIGE